jgi:hypothetical protein
LITPHTPLTLKRLPRARRSEHPEGLAMNKLNNPTLGDLPEVLTAEDITQYLRINLRRVYDNLNLQPHAGGIPNFKMGKQKRIIKDDFVTWINKQKGV